MSDIQAYDGEWGIYTSFDYGLLIARWNNDFDFESWDPPPGEEWEEIAG